MIIDHDCQLSASSSLQKRLVACDKSANRWSQNVANIKSLSTQSDCKLNSSASPAKQHETELINLPCGTVQIKVCEDNMCMNGWVSSHHLVCD